MTPFRYSLQAHTRLNHQRSIYSTLPAAGVRSFDLEWRLSGSSTDRNGSIGLIGSRLWRHRLRSGNSGHPSLWCDSSVADIEGKSLNAARLCPWEVSIVATWPERSVTDVLWQTIVCAEPRNPALHKDMYPRRKQSGIVQ
jgi:hypothetical protein